MLSSLDGGERHRDVQITRRGVVDDLDSRVIHESFVGGEGLGTLNSAALRRAESRLEPTRPMTSTLPRRRTASMWRDDNLSDVGTTLRTRISQFNGKSRRQRVNDHDMMR